MQNPWKQRLILYMCIHLYIMVLYQDMNLFKGARPLGFFEKTYCLPRLMFFPNLYTPPKTNIAPENGLLEDEIPIGNHPFSAAMLVSGRVASKDNFHVLDVCFLSMFPSFRGSNR